VRKVNPLSYLPTAQLTLLISEPTNTAESKPQQKHANSAPPSPEKGSSAKVAASTSKPHCPTTSKPKTRVIESDNESNSQKEVDEAEDEVVEDPLEKYEKMMEEIQCKHLVYCMSFLSTYPSLTSTLSCYENTSIEEKIHVCKTYGQCLHWVKSRTRQQVKLRKGISARPACTSSHLSSFIVLIGLFISTKGYHWDHAFLKGTNSTLHIHIS
jgi:hypothetical protein